jgi:hypothetical protein
MSVTLIGHAHPANVEEILIRAQNAFSVLSAVDLILSGQSTVRPLLLRQFLELLALKVQLVHTFIYK